MHKGPKVIPTPYTFRFSRDHRTTIRHGLNAFLTTALAACIASTDAGQQGAHAWLCLIDDVDFLSVTVNGWGKQAPSIGRSPLRVNIRL
jgi:hypothetical protein